MRIPAAVHCGGWPASSGSAMTLTSSHKGTPKAAAVIPLSA